MKEELINSLIKQECFVFEGGPFTSSGGFPVPFFIDIRRLFSDPQTLNLITDEFSKIVKEHNIEAIAGAETAGIPFAAVVANKMNMPFFYVRKEPQNHGMKSVIAGLPPSKLKRVALIDDSVGGGGSVKVFINNLKKEGYTPVLFLSVLEMNIWNNGEERMNQMGKQEGFEYKYLITWQEWVNELFARKLISEKLFEFCIDAATDPLLFNKPSKMEEYAQGKLGETVWYKKFS